jgi:hypothetical protein
MLAWFKCLLRNQHNPVRHPLGGFRCADCGSVGADLDEMGFEGDGYVSPLRHSFRRNPEERTAGGWRPTRGGW